VWSEGDGDWEPSHSRRWIRLVGAVVVIALLAPVVVALLVVLI
jgi:hypothetical protein